MQPSSSPPLSSALKQTWTRDNLGTGKKLCHLPGPFNAFFTSILCDANTCPLQTGRRFQKALFYFNKIN